MGWFWETPSFYEKQEAVLDNINEVKTEFWPLIDDYLKSDYKSEENQLFLDWIKWKARELNKPQFDTLVYYINQRKEQTTWDDKMQLLKLWSELISNKSELLKEQIDNLWDKDFAIAWWESWDYKLSGDDIEYLWSNIYKIHVELEKRKNKYITYGKSFDFWIQYIPQSGVIKYRDDMWNTWRVVVDHKRETVEKWEIHRNWNTTAYERRIFDRWVTTPVKFKIYWRGVTLYLQFYEK